MRDKPTKPKTRPFLTTSAALALLLLWLLAGCETQPTQPPIVPAKPVRLAPLPSYARQPAMPPECLPTCLDGLTKERESWQTRLIGPISPGGLASGNSTAPAKH